MILKTAKVTEYKSIWDSGEFEIGDITCLVGKNEAGKTAILEALYRVNPIIPTDSGFDVTDDYPRAYVSDYEEEVRERERNPAQVIEAHFELEEADRDDVEDLFGPNIFQNHKLVELAYYPNPDDEEHFEKRFSLSVDESRAYSHLIEKADLSATLADSLKAKMDDPAGILAALKEAEETAETKRLLQIFTNIAKSSLKKYIYSQFISRRVPKFLYFDEYYQMAGRENIEALQMRVEKDDLLPSDYPMLGLIGLAGIDLSALADSNRTQEIKNKLEGAGNRLSRKVLKYWSQNKHVRMRIDVRPAQSGDPEGMRKGTNIWADIYDSRHEVSTNLGTRSKGFVWFFSFLAWYSRVQKEHKNEDLILLLDEPGLFLHGRAQEDLLEYFAAELQGKHQVIYTTHSPFMVDASKFHQIRIVQDKGIDSDEALDRAVDGTKVVTDVLEASDDSLFPLQGALGYEIHQTLFVGKNCLVVEGVSDLLYIQTISGVLSRTGREALSEEWTITPVGGIDKVPTFVALLGSQKKLRVATLIDYQDKDQQTIENLYKRRILKKKDVHTYADFTDGKEADAEDMFGIDFYLELINGEFGTEVGAPIKKTDIKGKHPRVVVRIEKHIKKSLNHFRPARYLVENIAVMEAKIPSDALDRFENAFKKLNALL
jgi:predicted ATP-dependent endonuclease of OLD family